MPSSSVSGASPAGWPATLAVEPRREVAREAVARGGREAGAPGEEGAHGGEVLLR